MKTLIVWAMVFSASIAAANQVNDDDKTETHILQNGNTNIGTITVRARFVGEPVIKPTLITVSVTCARGYTRDPKAQQSIKAYDYGANGLLSQWNASTKILTIHHRSARIVDGSAVFEGSHTTQVNLSNACTNASSSRRETAPAPTNERPPAQRQPVTSDPFVIQ